MVNFEVGDRVRCVKVNNPFQDIEIGKEYTITEVDKKGKYVKVDNLNYDIFSWKFELIQKKAYDIW